jgi:3-isopropylmalate/(R)-2-methylmalate dehydratase large subunit
MTITEKILVDHAGLEKIEPGDLINVKIDIAMGNDITFAPMMDELERIGLDRVFDRERIFLIPDHFAPNKDVKSAENCKRMKEFARRH